MRKMACLFLIAVFLLPLVMFSAPSVTAQGPVLQTISNLNVRSGPGADYSVLSTVQRGVGVYVEGRNRVGNWVLIHSGNNTVRGWVASRYLIWGDVDLGSLPVLNTIVTSISPGMVEAGEGSVSNVEATASSTITTTLIWQGPGTGFPTIVWVSGGASVVVEGISPDGEWILAHTADGQWRGWFLRSHISLGEDVASLPAADEVIANPGVYQGFVTRLEAAPVMPGVTQRTQEIFQSGLAQGDRRNVFSKVGDCHTDHLGFFVPFGVGEYDLGGYGDLQSTIDYFNVSPRDGTTNSFVNESMAASSAFSAAAVLDPMWSDPMNCQSGESPLACEYRLVHPSIALIQFGSVDMQIYEVQDFAYYLREIVNESINQGIVPVLTTFPSNENYLWEKSLQFNVIILDIAQQEQIPVINFWAALRGLPNRGLEGDNFHLSYSGERWINLNGDQNQWGMEMRNLVTLQALHELQYNLLMQ